MKQNERSNVKAIQSMSVMFSILTIVFLITAVYPLLHIAFSFTFKHSFLLFQLFLMTGNSINPFIYFAFSPPVLKLIKSVRKYVEQICRPKTLYPFSNYKKKYMIRRSTLRKNAKSQDIEIKFIGSNPNQKHAITSTLFPVQVYKKT
jgi:nitrate reductase NapE component